LAEQGPHTLGTPTRVCHKFMRSNLPISKNVKNIYEKKTSRKYWVLYTQGSYVQT